MTSMWVFPLLTGAVVGWFVWVVTKRGRRVDVVPAPSTFEVGEALGRYSQMRRVLIGVSTLTAFGVVGAVWLATTTGDPFALSIAVIAAELTVLSWALVKDSKVRCAQLGIPDAATYIRQL